MTRRTAIVSTLLLTLSALVAAPAVFGQPTTAAHDEVPVVVSEIRFDGSLLPDESSWFALAVRADQEAWLTLEGEMPLPLDASRSSRAYLLFAIAERSDIPAAGWSGYEGTFPLASVQNARLGSFECCAPLLHAEPGGPGSGGIGDIYLDAGETLYVGLMGANLDVATGDVTLRAIGANLEVVDTLQGTHVELVDLRERARQQGTYAEALGRTLLSRPGSATVEWGGRGFLNVDVHAFGDARATLSIETPSGRHVQDEVIAEEWASLVAYEQGQFRVTLDGLREPVELLQDRGEVRAEAFYADLGLPGEGVYWWIAG